MCSVPSVFVCINLKVTRFLSFTHFFKHCFYFEQYKSKSKRKKSPEDQNKSFSDGFMKAMAYHAYPVGIQPSRFTVAIRASRCVFRNLNTLISDRKLVNEPLMFFN